MSDKLKEKIVKFVYKILKYDPMKEKLKVSVVPVNTVCLRGRTQIPMYDQRSAVIGKEKVDEFVQDEMMRDLASKLIKEDLLTINREYNYGEDILSMDYIVNIVK